jgi:hypothetical protein
MRAPVRPTYPQDVASNALDKLRGAYSAPMDADFPNFAERAANWRKRAEELRTLGESMKDDLARDNLETLAKQWEAMAARLEKQVIAPA